MALDHRDFAPPGSKAPGRPAGEFDRRWWLMKGDDAAASIRDCVGFLQRTQSARIAQYFLAAKLYGNLPMFGSIAGLALGSPQISSSGASTGRAMAPTERLTYNVIQSTVDTVQAKMAKNEPMPYYITSGGNYRLQRTAKKMTKFLEGIFYENHAYELGIDSFRDGGLWGDGWIKVFAEHNRIKYERSLGCELWVDEAEAIYGFPRSMYQVRNVDRALLSSLFPGQKETIKKANSGLVGWGDGARSIADMVTVIESWHLPSSAESDDGRHCLTVDGHMLAPMEKWKRSVFPFARMTWSKRPIGFWSQGGVEQIQNIQVQINKLLWLLSVSWHRAGTFKVLIANGSKIVKEHLNNDIGTIVTYTGTPPQYIVPQIIPPELYQQLQVLVSRAYEQFGVSMLSASAQKPAGLNAAVALREYDDIGSERFMVTGKRYEDLFMQLGSLSIETMQEIAENDSSYSVSIPAGKWLETVNWSDLDLEAEQFVLRCFPVSSLPQRPEARLQSVQELVQAGWLTPRQGNRLIGYPDLEQAESLQTAAEDFITQTLEQIVDEGKAPKYWPDEFDDLNLARTMALEFYQRGKAQDLEPERLELLRRYINQVNALQQQGSAPQLPTPTQGGQPQAPPVPPPPSPFVPNVPPQATA